MSLPRPIAAALSLAIVGAGFVGPWQLGWLTPVPELEGLEISAPVERVAVYQPMHLDLTLEPDPLEQADPVQEVEEDPSPPESDPTPPDPDPQDTPEPDPTGEDTLAPTADDDLEPPPGADKPALGELNGLQLEALARGPSSTVAGSPAGVEGGDNTEHVRRTRAPRKAPKVTHQNCEPERADIFAVSETAYRIEDQVIAHYAAHPKEAEDLAPTWWAKDDQGERRGFKVGRIRCGTLLDQAGFRSGDIIQAVNGREIQSYSEAVTAFLALRNRKVLWVDIERRGEPVRLDYHLVEEGTAQVPEGQDIVDPTALVDAELADPKLADRFEAWGDVRQDRRDTRSERREARSSERKQRRLGRRAKD